MDDLHGAVAGRIARIYCALEGGIYADEAERQIAAEMERRFPGRMRLMKATRRFHARAALWAVTEGGAKGVVFVSAGYPGHPVNPEPHEDALAAVPSARFAYVSGCPDITRYCAAVLGGPQVAAVTGSALDPERVMALPEITGIGVPLSVQVQLAAQFWPGPMAADMAVRWARLLPSGSSLVLSLAIPGPATSSPPWPYVSTVMGPLYAHAEDDVAGWLEDAGLRVVPPGITDVRAWPQGEEWAGHGRRAAGTIMAAVAVKP
jgi:hypothetical protein